MKVCSLLARVGAGEHWDLLQDQFDSQSESEEAGSLTFSRLWLEERNTVSRPKKKRKVKGIDVALPPGFPI